MKQPQTITQVLAHAKDRPRDWIALKYKQGGHWLSYSWHEYYEKVEIIASALHKLDVRKGDHVGLMADSSLEWLITDLAIMSLGAITVPIYASQRADEVRLIINDAKITLLVLENANQWAKWNEVRSRCPSVKSTLVFHHGTDIPNEVLAWSELVELGIKARAENPLLIAQSISSQVSSDVATVIYTSGTTGEPKGVVLTHLQILSEATAVTNAFPLSEKDISLAFLPFAHILARVEAFVGIQSSFGLAFAESMERIRQNLLEVRPTILIAVPRVFEKLQVAIVSQAQSRPAQWKLFNWAMDIGRQVSEARQESRSPSPLLQIQYMTAQRLVFARVKKVFGGRLRYAISGGAPLSAEIARFFHAMGILVLEGYGLTETTAAVTVNTPVAYRFGTVGRTLPGSEIRIADDGEILVKGPTVMKEYYGRADETTQVLTKGFLHTGDIGEFDSDGFLRVTDRKKDLIKTSGGKYVAPQKLENLLKVNPLVSHALIHGDQEKYIVALLTLNQAELTQYAKAQELSFQDYASLCQHPMVRALVRGVVAQVNAQLASFETIKNFAVLPHEFSVAAGELTPSLKVKRRFCQEKYRAEIAALYE